MKTQVSEKQAEARMSRLYYVEITLVNTDPDVCDEVISTVYYRRKSDAWGYFARSYGEYCTNHPNSVNYLRTLHRGDGLQAFAYICLSSERWIGIYLKKRARD